MPTGNGHRIWPWSRRALPMRLLPMPRTQAHCRASRFQSKTSTVLTIRKPLPAHRRRCPHPGKPKAISSAACAPSGPFFPARRTRSSSLSADWASTVIGERPETPGTQIPIVFPVAQAAGPASACAKGPHWWLWALIRLAPYVSRQASPETLASRPAMAVGLSPASFRSARRLIPLAF